MKNLGSRLKTLRQKKQLTQAELADILSVTKSMISAYENNIRMPSYDILIHLSQLFDVSTDFLLCNEQSRSIDISGLSPSVQEAMLSLLDAIKNDQ